MRIKISTTVLAIAIGAAAPEATAAAGAVVPVTAAEAQLRGLAAGPHGRFGSTESTVAQVGDVNGDGKTDVAVAAPAADPKGRRDAGSVHVVFGGSALGRIDVDAANGLRILGPRQGLDKPTPAFAADGAPAGAMAGTSVAGAGDVNGDGLADLVIGAPFTGHRKRAFSGSAYVVFGRREAGTIDLERLGKQGFRIDGPRAESAAGVTVAGPGDMNGDGRADVAVSAGTVQRSAVHVVHGKAGASAVDLRRLGRGGFTIGSKHRYADVARAVSGAGDFNGDGLADLAISAPQWGPAGPDGAGYTAVVFGGRHRGRLVAEELGARGLLILGEHEFANFGEALAPLGDVNGDGRGDLLAGASQVTDLGRSYAGAAYVIYGRPGGDVDLRAPGAAAFRIIGPTAGDGQARAGSAVAALPDVNGDGRTDLLIGAPGAGRTCSPDEGAAFVVFTPATPTPLDLENLGPAGYAITGVDAADGVGVGVASAGDWNGDGRGDALILRDPFPADERPRAPRADLVLGRTPAVPAPLAPEQLPSAVVPRPQVRELVSARGLEATVTVPSASPGDFVLVEIRTSVFGEPMPLAVAYARVGAPGARTLHAKTPKQFRPALRRRTKLPVEVVVSQCTRAGQVHETRSRLELR